MSCGAMPGEHRGYTPIEIAAQVGLGVLVRCNQFCLHWTAIFLAMYGGWH